MASVWNLHPRRSSKGNCKGKFQVPIMDYRTGYLAPVKFLFFSRDKSYKGGSGHDSYDEYYDSGSGQESSDKNASVLVESTVGSKRCAKENDTIVNMRSSTIFKITF